MQRIVQDGALIGFAEGKLSHTPVSTAKCFSDSGYSGTSKSNLALGSVGIKAVDAYIDDYGDNNTSVGHRSWLLSRSLAPITTGDIDANGTFYGANAIYVTGSGAPIATPRDGYIAWPPNGYVPDSVMYGRWSFTVRGTGISFQNANVVVSGPGGSIPVAIQSRSGFLEPGIVFTPAISSQKVTVDTTYNVTISGITGGNTSSYSYQVVVVHVNQPPKEASRSSWSATTCASPFSDLLQYNFSDSDGDSVTYRLVDGVGSTDNSLFRISSKGVIQNIAQLNSSQTQYYLRYEAEDTNGWKIQKAFVLNVLNSNSGNSNSCPANSSSNNGTNFSYLKNLKRGVSAHLSQFGKIPSGKKTFTTSGPCTLNTSRLTIRAHRYKRGTCTVAITYTTRSVTGKRLLKTARIKLRVV
jgi:hypothetical protein